MLRISLLALAIAAGAHAQAVYDFNALNGSDTRPYTPLDKQDAWSQETFRAPNGCGVTATLSHDGSKALRFREVGPGYGCDASRINDAKWSFAKFQGTEQAAYFQADIPVGFWGGSFALGHDTNKDGKLRGRQTGELGVRFTVGAQANVQLRLVDATGKVTRVPLSNAGVVGGGDWLRIRVIMDLSASSGRGLAWVDVENLTKKTTNVAVSGLQGIPLALDQTATDARNPKLWDAMWLHFEGATYGLDNIEIGTESARAIAFGKGCGRPALSIRGAARPRLGDTASAVSTSFPSASKVGILMLGFIPFTQGIDLGAGGAPGCFLNINPALFFGFPITNPTVTHTLPIPKQNSFAKRNIYLQTVAIDASQNALGLLTSNGLNWKTDLR